MHYKGSIAEVFEKNDSGIYKGKLINKYLSFRKNGDYKLDFKIVSKNSKYLQAIVLLLNSDFKGMFHINNKKIAKPKGKFPKIILWENDIPEEFSIYVHSEEGSFNILNGCTIPMNNISYCNMMTGGCAIIIETLGENHYRLNCNDVERDDDFDDLIFEVSYSKSGNTGDGPVC